MLSQKESSSLSSFFEGMKGAFPFAFVAFRAAWDVGEEEREVDGARDGLNSNLEHFNEYII